MKVALGMKAHSGWAALVILGKPGSERQVVERSRMELVDEHEAAWARQPYHAADALKGDQGRSLVGRGVASAHRIATREVRAVVKRMREAGHQILACAVLVADPMPDWTVDEILAVHFRMHKAEGVLFRDALVRAAEECDLRVLKLHEKELDEHAERTLATSVEDLRKFIIALGKTVGPPWGKDQKDAALAAMIALRGK